MKTEKTVGRILILLVWLFLIGLFVVTVTACNPFAIDPLANYIIDEGEHTSYSYNYFNKKRENIVAPILITGNRVDFSFTFKDNHKYDFTIKDGGDINKLYGITSPKIHENSARFGWRYIGDDRFEVYAYYYVRGERNWKLLAIVETNERLLYSIDVSGHQYTFGVAGQWLTVRDTKNIMAFRAFPYYGGDNPAPHTMYFLITEL